MMDWVAKLLGLDPSWHNSSGVGGGIIMVSVSPLHLSFCADRSQLERRDLHRRLA